MEEEKAVAYYDELTRKGSGAARFKQGLGFSSTNDPPPSSSSSFSSSFVTTFVKQSNPCNSKDVSKETQLQNIQNKLKKTPPFDETSVSVRVKVRRDNNDRDMGRKRDRDRESYSRSGGVDEEERDRSRSRDRRRRRRSRSRSSSDRDRRRGRERRRSRSRSVSPRDRGRVEKSRVDGRRERKVVKKESNGVVDYAKLIHGYDRMTPAERVKAKMKVQLSQTAQKDANLGTGSRWERFEFDKDAPVDDEEIAAGDDDAAVVKRISQSFRFSSFEVKKEDEIRTAHDEAMFGAPGPAPSYTSESEGEIEDDNKKTNDDDMASSLLNEKVLVKQQGSWRDRARRNAE